MHTTCERVRENLNRFLDTDQSAKEASEVAAHLDTCPACRLEYDRLRAIQQGVRSLPQPSSEVAEAARVRAFARLEQAVLQEKPEKRSGWLRLPSFGKLTWQPMAAGLAAAVILAVVFAVPQLTPTEESTEVSTMPTASELSVLYDLHDVHSHNLSTDDPMIQRSRTADAHLTLLDHLPAEGTAQ